MNVRSSSEGHDEARVLDLFFSREGDAWRVFARPSVFPPYLRQYFDEQWEAYPVMLDLEDLERRMAGVRYEKRTSKSGGFQLLAQGSAAMTVASWLSTALASGVRARTDDA